MLSNVRRLVLLGTWAGLCAIIVAASNGMGANLSTTALLLALGATPGIVMLMLEHGAPSPSVAEILHAATKDGRP